MPRNYLFGPVDAQFNHEYLQSFRQEGTCKSFGYGSGCDYQIKPQNSWKELARQFSQDWQPDFLALYLPYTHLPPDIWSAPWPIVGLAADWNLLWHYYRLILPCCDWVLCDRQGVEQLRLLGLPEVHEAPLFGGGQWLFRDSWPEVERDIDILFVGNLHSEVQSERLPWLARLALLGQHYRVVIRQGVFGEDYRKLLARAKIVFNRSIRGECNKRVWEAAAAGALLFQEAENLEVPDFLEDKVDCIYYTADNLESLLVQYLENEEARKTMAQSAQAKANHNSFASAWSKICQTLEDHWENLQARSKKRLSIQGNKAFWARTWALLSNGLDLDNNLPAVLESLIQSPSRHPLAYLAMGVVLGQLQTKGMKITASALQSIKTWFARAGEVMPRNPLVWLNQAEVSWLQQNHAEAIQQATRGLQCLAQQPGSLWEGWHFPVGYDLFRVEWEKAGWRNAGNPEEEDRQKRQLVAWRLRTLLGDLTGELTHYYEAAMLRPDLAISQAALGCALARNDQLREATDHLYQAVTANPLDRQAARALGEILQQRGQREELSKLLEQQRLLAKSFPGEIAQEAWFAETPLTGQELTSLIILCCNQLDFTQQCLESVFQHTKAPYEVILVDNGSTDGTWEYLEAIQHHPGPERIHLLHNQENLGFARGCNQGLAVAKGAFLVLLNNDTLVTKSWLEGLLKWVVMDWPKNGMVGPLTNYASPPQQIQVTYQTHQQLANFAAKQNADHFGEALETDRLIGFCLLFRRDVWQNIGGLDERFGLGFFEDDDLGVRARKAGYRLLIAQDVFIHHYGNRTFQGLGLDAHAMLQENFTKFEAKWGQEYAKGYHLPPKPETSNPQLEGNHQPPTQVGDRTGAPVSLTMIVKNGASSLARCLQSVVDLVSEVIVVDTGSTDNSRDIARKHGARVMDFAWRDSFAAARNEALRHATMDWIFWLDADEYLDSENRTKLRNLLANLPGQDLAFLMRQSSPLPDAPHAITAVDQVRLFRADPNLRWQYRVHEQILPALRLRGAELANTEILIQHAGFAVALEQQQKIDRNRRLLELEIAEHPEDAFVLYNLGGILFSAGDFDQARDLLEKSLQRCQPGESLTPKIYCLLVRIDHQNGNLEAALDRCQQGLEACPGQGELLFWRAVIHKDQGKLADAITSLEQILLLPPTNQLTGGDAGLYTYRTRSLLAEILLQADRPQEAEQQWWAIVKDYPDFLPAWQELGKLFLHQQRWPELESMLAEMKKYAPLETILLQGRVYLAREEFQAARDLLENALQYQPRSLSLRILLGDVLLKEAKDIEAAQKALEAVLELDPNHSSTVHNLKELRKSLPKKSKKRKPQKPVPKAKITLNMIVRNEEKNLGNCLSSIANLFDEMIIVDTGSTDRTKEIALQHGAKVFDFPWIDHFAAARNEALRHSSGDWIFWLDADDFLDETNRHDLKALLDHLPKEDRAGYLMQCLCLPDLDTQRSTVVDHVRLFSRLPRLNWQFRVHEQILPSLRQMGAEIRTCNITICHTGYQNPAFHPQKVKRNLRLLELELQDQPGHPFTLFNLGSVFQEQGRLQEAINHFQQSLERSATTDSITRKLFTLLAQCYRQLGHIETSLLYCAQGLQLFPDDLELLFQQGIAMKEAGKLQQAEQAWLTVLKLPPRDYFASVDVGLGSFRTRMNLAHLYQQQNRLDDALIQLNLVLEEQPNYLSAVLAIAEILLVQNKISDVEHAIAKMEALGADLEASVIKARCLLANKDFDNARQLLEQTIVRFPLEVWPRVILSHVLLQQNQDLETTEQVLRDILAINPNLLESKKNLLALLQTQKRNYIISELEKMYLNTCSPPSELHEHCPRLYALARSCTHITVIGPSYENTLPCLLFAKPGCLVAFGPKEENPLAEFQQHAGRTKLIFKEMETLANSLLETDFLLVNLSALPTQILEDFLKNHPHVIKKFLAFHNLDFLDNSDQPRGEWGLPLSMEAILKENSFHLRNRLLSCQGFLIFEKNESNFFR